MRSVWNRAGPLRGLAAVTIALLIGPLSACSGDDSMTMTEYAETIEGLVNTMNRSLDILDAEAAGELTVEGERHRWAERAKVRRTFLCERYAELIEEMYCND